MDGLTQPTNLGEDEGMTPLECFERCAHSGACVRVFGRCDGVTLDLDTLAEQLDCGDCDQWEEDETPALRRMVKQLIETVRVGEGLSECALMAGRLKENLCKLGFDVDGKE
jgi:hypothetical protein